MMPNGTLQGHYETSQTVVRARKPYVKAGGITTLEPLVRHGKGKLQEAASEVLKLLSQVDPLPQKVQTLPATSHVARFDGGPIEQPLCPIQTNCDGLKFQPFYFIGIIFAPTIPNIV